MRRLPILFALCFCLIACKKDMPPKPGEVNYRRPNILFVISDDQSWEHTSFAGYPFVKTPHFDRIAREGIYFENAYAAAPSCTASRSAILTGQYPWRLKSAAVLGSQWPADMATYPQILRQHGYHVGYTGKGWGPGRIDDFKNPPDGKSYFFEGKKKFFWQPSPPHPQATSLALFLHQRPSDAPFAFWVGIREPHRPFENGDISRFKKAPDGKFIPGFLPDTATVRQDLAAYLEQIEAYDRILGQLIEQLEDYEVLENTVIVVTSDNGMSFSRAKTQNYQYGVKVPLAMYWPAVSRGRVRAADMVGLYDLAPTFLELAELPVPQEMNGRSLVELLYRDREDPPDAGRDAVFTLTERHSYDARPGHLGYPTRAIYTRDFALIRNYFPDRFPAGNENTEAEAHLLVDPDSLQALEPYYSQATAKRPPLELYSLREDPYQLHNLATEPTYRETGQQLRQRLEDTLVRSKDPLQQTGKDIFSTYPWLMQ